MADYPTSVSTLASEVKNTIASVEPDHVPRAPKTRQSSTKSATFEVTDETKMRATKTCSYYRVIEDENGNCTVKGNCVIQGAVSRWYRDLKEKKPLDEYCIYSPSLRVCCSKKVLFKLAEQVCKNLAAIGTITTPQEFYDKSITFLNHKKSMKTTFEKEIKTYNEFRDKRQAEKPRQNKLDLKNRDLCIIAKDMSHQLKSSGSSKKTIRRDVKDIRDQLKLVLENPQYKYNVIDVSNFGSKNGVVSGKFISASEAKNSNKICVDKIKVVSKDPSSFRKAMEYLGEGYEKYNAAFDEISTKKSVN